MFHTIKLIPFILLLSLSCASMHPEQKGSKPVNHDVFNALLTKYVDAQGGVNYAALKKDNQSLNSYVDMLSKNGPDESTWSKDEQLTYWINAYNALTLQLVLKYYPIKSIRELGSSIKIPLVSTAWDIEVFSVGGESLSLNNIEHNIIRKNFEEPRIHFVLVCAAKSCPKLRNEAYAVDRLEEQLADQTRDFLSNPTKNKITENKLQLSKLFSWYEGDFTKNESLISFLDKYTDVTIGKRPSKKFMDYDWSLNEQ